MRPINRCLNHQLAKLCHHSIQLEELSNKIKKILPSDLSSRCQVGSFNQGALILTTSDANWASQLRYALPELRDRLRNEAKMYQLTSIKIIITETQDPYQNTKPSPTKKISEKSRSLIINESQFCAYEPLQKALLKLAENPLTTQPEI